MGVQVEAVRIVEDEVRELIRRRGLDPLRESGEVRRLVEAAVSDYDERALLAPLPPLGPLESARRFVFDAVAGFGALQPLLDDPGIEEIWLNAPNEIYVARNGESELTSVSLTDQQVRDLVERMLKSSGRRLDMSSPFVDAALPDAEFRSPILRRAACPGSKQRGCCLDERPAAACPGSTRRGYCLGGLRRDAGCLTHHRIHRRCLPLLPTSP